MKQIIKRTIDLAMVVFLPLLMLEILIGQETHEWLGTAMLALFVAHHLLNLGWWKGLLKGKYTPSRASQTALDLLLLLDMAALGVSGVMMSGFVFRFLGISGGMIIARQLHLLASYWGFILMLAHLGMHLGQFFPLFRKLFRLSEKNTKRTYVLRIIAIVLSAYGLYAFIDQHIADYLFLQTHFVMFDETKSAAVYFAETVAMMGLFAAAAYYLNKLGYPNWWASIPMPIASFLEEYDFSGKTIIPFCSHGGGRFGQSLTAITKLAPDAVMGEPLSIHYSGGGSLPDDIAAWLKTNELPTK